LEEEYLYPFQGVIKIFAVETDKYHKIQPRFELGDPQMQVQGVTAALNRLSAEKIIYL
jgi:hypothetical protein